MKNLPIFVLGGAGVVLWGIFQGMQRLAYILEPRKGETVVLICPEAHPVMIDMTVRLLRLGMKVLVVLGQHVDVVYFRSMALGWNPVEGRNLGLVRVDIDCLEACYRCAIDIAKQRPEIHYLLTFPQISDAPRTSVTPLDYFLKVNHLSPLLFHLELAKCMKPTSVAVVVYRNAKFVRANVNKFTVQKMTSPRANLRDSFTTSDIASILSTKELAKRFKHQVFSVDLNEGRPWTLFRRYGYLLGYITYQVYTFELSYMPMGAYRMFTLGYYLLGRNEVIRKNGLPHSNYDPQPDLLPKDESIISATWIESCKLIAEKAPKSVAKNMLPSL